MAGRRQTADSAKAQVNDALTDARPRAHGRAGSVPPAAQAVLALQRAGGNAAVNALLAGRMRFPGDEAVADIDGALRELRRDEPAPDTVEKGLKAAKAAGVPVDLEGVRPPASALAVTTTGFGPGAVPAKKPVPPPKKVPAVSPLGRAGAKKAAGPKGKGGAKPGVGAGSTSAGPTAAPKPLGADALLQPPVPPSQVRPEDDPAFTAVTSKVKATAREKRSHPPAASKAKEAQDAALPPAGDIASQAKASKADTMEAQQPGTFDKKAFITAVKAAIEAKSPKTMKEADDYKSSGKAGEVKSEVKGLVTEGKEGQTKDIKGATEAPPDESKALPKQVTPMGPESPGQAVPIPATGAVPKPAPAEQLNLEAGKHEANAEMAEAEVDESQLAESNEPQFEGALADKKAAADHADTAPGEFRQQEAQVIAQGKSEAAAETTTGVAGMQSSKAAALAKLVADKGKAKSKDEAKRAEVTTKIEGIFNATEADVKKILDGIDPLVEKEFGEGEAAARAKFENYTAAKMSAYKEDRYGGWLGPFRWARDKIKGMPDKVNEFYVAGRELYLKEMDKVISRVATIVGDNLSAAKKRIVTGRNEIAKYVESLPKDLKKVGAEASQEIGDRFEQLESDVDAKQEALVDTLASKYVEARKGLDERIEELQAENRGLIDKAIGAIKAVINTIRELAAMLRDVLARAAGVVGQIIKHPVAFLENLIAGVKGGILKFKEDFLGHLQRGLFSWLFGALAEGGIELPKSFDPKGILGFLASIFGLTWTNIRNRIIKRIGEKAMGAVEQGVEIFKIISGPEGVGGVWELMLTKLGNIKDMIFEKVKGFVQDRIITAGITWLIGLLNPAAAFIKACKLIYDVVMFFVNNASRIKKFVDTILDSVADIVRGNIGGVINKINDVLGQMVPLIIGFLASVIGLGGIGAKVREIIQALQKPVNKAVDFVIDTGLKVAAPIIRGLAGVSSKVKAKVAAGKAWLKSKVYGGDDSPEGKQKRLDLAMNAAQVAANKFAGKKVASRLIAPVLALVKRRYGLESLTLVKGGATWQVEGAINPRAMRPTDVLVFDDEYAAAAEFARTANEVEREFFATGLEGTGSLAVRGPAEQAFAGSVARRGTPAMGAGVAEPARLEGASSREQIRARRGALAAHQQAGGGGLPRNAVATGTIGEDGSLTEMLNPTRNQPFNAKINEVGAYGLPTAATSSGEVMGVINFLRANEMSDAQISRVMQLISREGRTPTVEMLVEHGFKGDPNEPVRTGRSRLQPANALRAVTQLTHVLEPLRFLSRGFGLAQQPIATTTAMSHSLVQAGEASLNEVLASEAPLGPATHLRLGDTARLKRETIAASQVRITMLVEQVRKRWENWVLETQAHITAELKASGIVKPHLVPTKEFMRGLLTDFYGEVTRRNE